MRTHHGLYYDSRIKLLLILLTSALAFALGGGLTGLLLFGVVCLFSFLSGLWKTSIKFLTAYIALLMLAQILPIHLSSVITFFLLRILTIALALNILFQTTEIAELIASLQVSHVVFRKLTLDKLHTALLQLPKEERALIYALFFDGKTESEVAKHLGVSRQAIQKRKNRILKKLKKFFE